ncbi:MAG: C39 family peptidase [Candidatus Wallbacteria bacterium]|nr:C39 family peptidase [Candidatus Wallbacteria bacterium]
MARVSGENEGSGAFEPVRSAFARGAIAEAYALLRGPTGTRATTGADYRLAAEVFRGAGRDRRRDALVRLTRARFPEQHETLLSWISVLASHGWLLAAEETATKGLAASEGPEAARFEASLGSVRVQQGRLGPGLTLCERAVDCQPDDPVVRYELAWAHLMSAQPARAVAEYRTVLQARPSWARARVLLAYALENQQRYEEALHELKSAPPDSAEDCLSLLSTGLLLRDLKRLDEAAAVLERMLEQYPDADLALTARHLLAGSLRNLGNRSGLGALLAQDDELKSYWSPALTAGPAPEPIAVPHKTQHYNGCDPTSLAMIAEGLLGVSQAPSDFAKLRARPGAVVEPLLEVLEEKQLAHRFLESSAQSVAACVRAGFPVLLLSPGVFSGHAVVIVGHDPALDEFYVRDPSAGMLTRLSGDLVAALWKTAGFWALGVGKRDSTEALSRVEVGPAPEVGLLRDVLELRRTGRAAEVEGLLSRWSDAQQETGVDPLGVLQEALPPGLRLQAYRRLAARGPRSLVEWFVTARMLVAQGTLQEALVLVEHESAWPDALRQFLRAHAAWRAGYARQAFQHASVALRRLSREHDAWVLAAQTALSADNPSEASRAAGIAREWGGLDTLAVDLECEALVRLQRGEEAVALARQTTREKDGRRQAAAWSVRARVAQRIGAGREAWRCLRIAMSLADTLEDEPFVHAARHAQEQGYFALASAIVGELRSRPGYEPSPRIELLAAELLLDQECHREAIEVLANLAATKIVLLPQDETWRSRLLFRMSAEEREWTDALIHARAAYAGCELEAQVRLAGALLEIGCNGGDSLPGTIDDGLGLLQRVLEIEPEGHRLRELPVERLDPELLPRIEKLIDAALQHWPSNAELLLVLARILGATDRPGRQRELLIAILLEEPKNGEACGMLADVCYALGRVDEARAAQDRLSELGRWNHLALARNALMFDNVDLALRHAGLALRERPLDEGVAKMVFDWWRRLGHAERVERHARQARGWLCDGFLAEVEALRRKHEGAGAGGRTTAEGEAALAGWLAETVELHPDRWLLAKLWAEASRGEMLERCRDFLARRTEGHPERLGFRLLGAEILARLGDKPGALLAHAALERVTPAWQDNYEAALSLLGESEAALSLVERLVGSNAAEKEWRAGVLAATRALERLEKPVAAQRLLEDYLARDPQWAQGLAKISHFSPPTGSTRVPLADANTAYGLEPESSPCLWAVLLRTSDVDARRAIPLAEKMKQLRPSPAILTALGQVYARAGRLWSARAAYDEAIEADPVWISAVDEQIYLGAAPERVLEIFAPFAESQSGGELDGALAEWLRAHWFLRIPVPSKAESMIRRRLERMAAGAGVARDDRLVLEEGLRSILIRSGRTLEAMRRVPWAAPWTAVLSLSHVLFGRPAETAAASHPPPRREGPFWNAIGRAAPPRPAPGWQRTLESRPPRQRPAFPRRRRSPWRWVENAVKVGQVGGLVCLVVGCGAGILWTLANSSTASSVSPGAGLIGFFALQAMRGSGKTTRSRREADDFDDGSVLPPVVVDGASELEEAFRNWPSARATITRSEAQYMRRSDGSMYLEVCVQWRFRDLEGREHAGRTAEKQLPTELARYLGSTVSKGERHCVLYEAARPRWNALFLVSDLTDELSSYRVDPDVYGRFVLARKVLPAVLVAVVVAEVLAAALCPKLRLPPPLLPAVMGLASGLAMALACRRWPEFLVYANGRARRSGCALFVALVAALGAMAGTLLAIW